MESKASKQLVGCFIEDLDKIAVKVTKHNLNEIIDLMEIDEECEFAFDKLLSQGNVSAIYSDDNKDLIEVLYVSPTIYTKILTFTELVFQLQPSSVIDNDNGALRLFWSPDAF